MSTVSIPGAGEAFAVRPAPDPTVAVQLLLASLFYRRGLAVQEVEKLDAGAEIQTLARWPQSPSAELPS